MGLLSEMDKASGISSAPAKTVTNAPKKGLLAAMDSGAVAPAASVKSTPIAPFKLSKPLLSASTPALTKSAQPMGGTVANTLGIKPSTNLLPEIQREANGGKVVQPVQDKLTDTNVEKGAYLLGSALAGKKANTIGGGLRYDLARGAAGLVGGVESGVDWAVRGLNDTASTITSLGGTKPNAVSNWFGQGSQFTYDNDIGNAMKQGAIDSVGKNTNWASDVSGNLYDMAGNLVPMIGASKAISGVKGISSAIASKLPIAAVSGGQAGQQAYNEGATAKQASAYGNIQGALSAAIEGISGGIPGFGKGLTDNALASFVKSPAAMAAIYALGEGAENVLQDFVTPYIQRAIYNPEAQSATFKQMATDFAYGVGLSGLMQGANAVGNTGAKANVNTPENVNTPSEAVQSPVSDSTPNLVTDTAKAVETNTEPQANSEDTYKQSIQQQESNIKALEDKAEYEKAINRNLYAEYRSSDVETRRPELITEAAAQKAKVEAAENAVTKAKNDLQTFKDARANEIQNKADVEETVGILSDLKGRFVNENTLKEIEQIGALPKETAELRKAFDRATRLQNKSNELYSALTNAKSLQESIDTQAKLDKVNAQLETATQTLSAAQDKIANYKAPQAQAANGKTSLFPENSLGAKLSTPKQTNIPLADKGDVLTETYKNEKSFKVGAVVYAGDRGNYGHIMRDNSNGTYNVRFVSKDGSEATKTLSESELSSTKKGTFKTDYPETVDLNNLPEMGIGVAMTSDKAKTSLTDKLSKAYTHIVDTQSPIADGFAKAAKDKSGILASNTRNAGGIVNYIFTDNLVDTNGNVIGKSLKDIANEIPKGADGQGTDFWKYMAQKHNIDRAREGNNVDPTYTSEMSQKYVENADKAHPEYKAIGAEVVNWIDKFEKAWGVDSGLIGSDTYATLREKYKNYFPTQREFSDMETGLPREVARQFVDPKNPIKAATGSSRDLNNPIENIMNLVNMRVKAARYNEVGQEILKSVRNNPEGLKKYAEIVNEKDVAGHMTNDIVNVIENGERVYLKINDKPFLESLMGLPKNTTSIKVLSSVTQGFKNLITQKNPFFAVRNVARDVPTAYTYGSEGNPLKFAGGLLKAGKDVATNSPNYQRYKAVGGGMSNFFNSGNVEKSAVDLTKVGKRDTLINSLSKTVGDGVLGKAVTGTANAVLHPIETVEKFNNITESAPRVAEFNRIFNKTGDVQKALDASNNVTVNFARGGDVTKALDRNGVAYLNAGVQGLDKFVRSVNSPRKLATMLIRGGISITAPTLLLAYINKDDKDYDELTNYTKDNYFCIPIGAGHNDGTAGNGEFIKIPRSRELGVLMGALTERLMRVAKGEDNAFKGYGTSVATSFAPANPLTNNMLSPMISNLPSNKNFMGSAIVPQSMLSDGRSKSLQYDEKTSEITKFIAKYAAKAGVELSPKQMDYIIDAYTGVIADFALPATTKGGNVGNVVKKQFVADSATSNQALSDFYDKMDEAMQKASDKNITENIDPKTVTLEEKIKTNYANASKEISALSKVSMRTGIMGLTDDDKKLLTSYGIDSTANIQDIQKAVRMKQIEIAQAATARGTRADEMELDLNNNSTIAKSVEKYQSAGYTQKQAYDLYKTVEALDIGGNASQLEVAQALEKSNLSNKDKGNVWQLKTGGSNEKNPYTGTLAQLGVAPEKTIAIMGAYSKIDKTIDDNYVKPEGGAGAAQVKAAYLNQWLASQGYNAAQIAAITDVFTTWQMIPIDKPSAKANAFVSANPMS